MKNPTSEGIEIQLIKTTVTLKKVNITVRFPCSISFALKYGKLYVMKKPMLLNTKISMNSATASV